MMRLDEIRNPRFDTAKNGYDAYQVDGYINDVYDTVSKLIKTARQYEERLKSCDEAMAKYKADKEAISELLIESKSKAQKTKKEAEEAAAAIRDAANTEALEMRASAKAVMDNAEAAANQKYDEIIAAANEKANAITENANEQSARIVADAYGQASKAKEVSAKIKSEAEASLAEISRRVSDLRTAYSSITAQIERLFDTIDVPESVDDIIDDLPESVDEIIEDPVDFDAD